MGVKMANADVAQLEERDVRSVGDGPQPARPGPGPTPAINSSPPLPLVAMTPTELAVAQSSLSEWCERKLAELQRELDDAQANLAIAKKSKWRTAGFQTHISSVRRRIVFYEKAAAAVDHGYLLVPNFPIEAFAVRRDATATPYSEGRWPDNVADNPPMKLPAGEGEYMSPTPLTRQDVRKEVPRGEGKTEIEHWFSNAGVAELDFPVELAHPRVLDAVQKAMELRVFDRIGLVGGPHRRKGDPIVVGQILDPRTTTWSVRQLTFFISWHITYEML